MKFRLDQLLVEKNLARSRSQARSLIKEGKVKIDGEIKDKPGSSFSIDSNVEIGEETNFVGRGARKLAAAIEKFKIDPSGKIVADIGASTGGFTDLLIQNGAEKVYAIDVGKDQLAEKLVNDSRVINMEQTDARDLKELPEKVDLMVIDLSFISIRKVLPNLKNLLKNEGEIILLFKPQFEAGPKIVNKKGVILDPKVTQDIFREFKKWCIENNFKIKSWLECPVKGKQGNLEYLLHFTN